MKFRLTDTDIDEMSLILGDVVQNGEIKLIVGLAVGLYWNAHFNLDSLIVLNDSLLIRADDEVDMFAELEQGNS